MIGWIIATRVSKEIGLNSKVPRNESENAINFWIWNGWANEQLGKWANRRVKKKNEEERKKEETDKRSNIFKELRTKEEIKKKIERRLKEEREKKGRRKEKERKKKGRRKEEDRRKTGRKYPNISKTMPRTQSAFGSRSKRNSAHLQQHCDRENSGRGQNYTICHANGMALHCNGIFHSYESSKFP